MTLTITHNKVATLPDQPGAEVNKGEWNDAHAVIGDLTGYTITVSQISDATITTGSSVSGTNTGDQNLAPYLTSSTAASTYVPQTTTVNGQALSGNITITNISGNAATVTTNANQTGPITSVGNATSIGAQTGTGSTFVMSASPTITGTLTASGTIATGTVSSSGNLILNAASFTTVFFEVGGSVRGQIGSDTAMFTPGSSSTATDVRFGFIGAADATLTASTEAPSTYFNIGQTRQHSTGALTLQRDFRISGSTHSFVGASTAIDVAAFSIDKYGQAGTNATITNAHAILIQTQAVAGTVGTASAITVNAPTGATNNYAINVATGNILIGTAGNGLIIKSGSNARIGTGTLTAGTVTIANTSVTANTRVFLQDTTSGGLTNVGVLTAVTTAGTGFVVTSTLALDTSTFNWLLVESA